MVCLNTTDFPGPVNFPSVCNALQVEVILQFK